MYCDIVALNIVEYNDLEHLVLLNKAENEALCKFHVKIVFLQWLIYFNIEVVRTTWENHYTLRMTR
jgi:hypothetical protein